MYCKNCGNKVEENHKFCGKCGVLISGIKIQPLVSSISIKKEEVYEDLKPRESLWKEVNVSKEQRHLSSAEMYNLPLKMFGWLLLFFIGLILIMSTLGGQDNTITIEGDPYASGTLNGFTLQPK